VKTSSSSKLNLRVTITLVVIMWSAWKSGADCEPWPDCGRRACPTDCEARPFGRSCEAWLSGTDCGCRVSHRLCGRAIWYMSGLTNRWFWAQSIYQKLWGLTICYRLWGPAILYRLGALEISQGICVLNSWNCRIICNRLRRWWSLYTPIRE
jgi:hypothetical protein